MKLLFICWHQDQGLLGLVRERLTLLEQDGTIDSMAQMVIGPDGEVDPQAYGLLESAQVVCPLITANFLAMDWSKLTILHSATVTDNPDSRRVIPIRIEPCNFAASDWAKYSAVPADNHPVSEWRDANEGYEQVALDLRQFLQP